MFICTGEIKFIGVNPVFICFRMVIVDSPLASRDLVIANVLSGAALPSDTGVVLVFNLALVLWVDLHQESEPV